MEHKLSIGTGDETPVADWQPPALLDDKTNNNTTMTSALDCARQLAHHSTLTNMHCTSIEDEEQQAAIEAQLLQTDLDDLDAATARLLDFGGDSDQESHSSSLESEEPGKDARMAGENHQNGVLSDEEDALGSSTSCSVDSFELSNLSESGGFSMEDSRDRLRLDNGLLPVVEEIPEAGDSTTPSASSTCKSKLSLNEMRQSIDHELSQLDTAMPSLDFDKLEQQLASAAEEREMKQRKLMSEEVRRRLASDSDEQPSYFPPPPTTRPLKSNLAHRLQSGMNLQICFMNDATCDQQSSSEDDENPCSSQAVPKSRSTPNLASKKRNQMSRSASTADDSSKAASELRNEHQEPLDSDKLELETRLMLVKAKQAAHMQMEVERQTKNTCSHIEKIVGVPLTRKMSRMQLSKMGLTQLQLIVNELHTKIEKLNEVLVQLLIERDGLHMEQDSMLVDVEDLLQHCRQGDSPAMPGFLVQTAEPLSNNQRRFRIFKR